MNEIGNVKLTDVKRGNSGLDSKTFDVNKELLEAMRIIARQEVDRASRDITKNALVRSVNTDGTVNITLDGKEFNKIPNYTVGTVKANDVVKVTYPQNQASNMYVSGGTSIDEITNKLSNDINLINNTLNSHSNSINDINSNLNKAFILYSANTSTTWTLKADAGTQYTSDTGLFPTMDGYTRVFLSGHPNGVSGIIVYDNGWMFNTNQSDKSFTLTVNWLFIKSTLFQ